jgi:hypothetical protein
MADPIRKIRGIRTPLQQNTFVGRTSQGDGDAEMVPFDDVVTALNIGTDELSNVTATAPNDGDLISYDDASGKWIYTAPAGGGTFLSLTDTPATFTGQALKETRVNAGETALEFFVPPSVGATVANAFHIQDQKSSGTDGGTSSAATVHTRDLNTTITNTITGASLAANQITLAAGTYDIWAEAPAHDVTRHRLQLYNITDAAIEILGGSSHIGSGDNAVTGATLRGQLTITGSKVFELRHYTQSAKATLGLGVATSDGNVEVYANVLIRKVVGTTGAATQLNDIDDVNVPAPSDKNLVQWDNGTSKWIDAKLQVSATDKLLGRSTAGAGDVEEITLTAAGRALLDDANATAQRATLNVDVAGTDNSTDVTLAGALDYLTLSGQEITLGAIDLDADVSGVLPIASGGTGATGASGARINLGLGSAAVEDIGTSGANVPLLDGANTHSADNTFSAKIISDDLTDASSTTLAAIQTDGGIAAAKKIVAGQGIYLGGVVAANLLDDYNGAGSWTPGVDGGTVSITSVTLGKATGEYVKIGNMVVVRFEIILTAITIGAGSGSFRITNLPFTPNGNTFVPVAGFMLNWASGKPIAGVALTGTTTAQFYRDVGGTAVATIQIGELTGNEDFRGSMAYFV